MIEEKEYTEAVDWWAFGILAFELLFGRTPFSGKDRDRMYRLIRSMDVVFPPDADPVVTDFIRGLVQRDPARRLDFYGIRNHPFFAGIDFSKVLSKQYKPRYVPPRSPIFPGIGDFDSSALEMPAEDSLASPVDAEFDGFSCTVSIDPGDGIDEANSPLIDGKLNSDLTPTNLENLLLLPMLGTDL
jgi:serine/threonine protein kinase